MLHSNNTPVEDQQIQSGVQSERGLNQAPPCFPSSGHPHVLLLDVRVLSPLLSCRFTTIKVFHFLSRQRAAAGFVSSTQSWFRAIKDSIRLKGRHREELIFRSDLQTCPQALQAGSLL